MSQKGCVHLQGFRAQDKQPRTHQHGELENFVAQSPAVAFHTTYSERGLPQAIPTLSRPHQVVQRRTLAEKEYCVPVSVLLRTNRTGGVENGKGNSSDAQSGSSGSMRWSFLQSRSGSRSSAGPCWRRSGGILAITRDSRACFSNRRTLVKLFHPPRVRTSARLLALTARSSLAPPCRRALE